MDLHPRVRSAAEELYRNGHYRNAILDSAVALVNLVKEKSRRHDLDGAALMRTVFSRTTPVLAFNNGHSTAEGIAFEASIQAALDGIGSKLTMTELFNRAAETSCTGCHGFNGAVDFGGL